MPKFADWCTIDFLNEDQTISRMAVSHVDPAKNRTAEKLKNYKANLKASFGIGRVIQTGKPEFVETVDEQTLLARAPQEFLEIVRTLGFSSFIIVPIVARGKIYGALSLVLGANDEVARKYENSDLRIAEELGRRIGFAVENARLYQKADEAIRSRQDLLAIVSHDLKNPVSAIQMSASLIRMLLENQEFEAIEQPIRIIHSSTERMDRLINNLLDLETIAVKGLSMTKSKVSVGEMVDEMTVMMSPIAQQKHIAFEIELSNPETMIEADRDRIQQVFSNIVGNAVKFSPVNSSVKIAGEVSSSYYLFSISNKGPSISEIELPHIFDRYWQAKKGKRQGTGLGLSIAKGIVDAHGGKIWAQSEPKQGVTFSFTLPRINTFDQS